MDSKTTRDALNAMPEFLHCFHARQERRLRRELENGSGVDATSLMEVVTRIKSEADAFAKNLNWIQRDIALPKLLAERKQEKREKVMAKIQGDHQVISDRRKCKENLEPFPPGSFEIFESNCIWEKVLTHLSDPSDITSAFFTCKTFAGILEQRRLLINLQESVKILLETKTSSRPECPSLISKPDLMPLRRVSKPWKDIADRLIFEDEFMQESWHIGFPVQNKLSSRPDATWFTCRKSVDLALKCKASSSSPCLMRNLGVDRESLKKGNWNPGNKILNFLDVHGTSVWFFKFRGIGAMDDYGQLWEMVMRMPNLKAVELESVTKPESACSPEELRVLAEELERKQFPVLESLKHISTGHGKVNEFLLEAVFRRCANLRSVWQEMNANDGTRAALRGLSLDRFLEMGTGTPFILSQGITPTWPLKVVQIFGRMEEPLKCSVLWPILNNFQETLECFACGPDVMKDSDNDKVLLNLPRLKIFYMAVIKYGVTIGFDDLLLLKSLEQLSVLFYDGDLDLEPGAKAVVQVSSEEKDMKVSNIWQCFPHLKLLKLNCKTFVKKGGKVTCLKDCPRPS